MKYLKLCKCYEAPIIIPFSEEDENRLEEICDHLIRIGKLDWFEITEFFAEEDIIDIIERTW